MSVTLGLGKTIFLRPFLFPNHSQDQLNVKFSVKKIQLFSSPLFSSFHLHCTWHGISLHMRTSCGAHFWMANWLYFHFQWAFVLITHWPPFPLLPWASRTVVIKYRVRAWAGLGVSTVLIEWKEENFVGSSTVQSQAQGKFWITRGL